MKVLTCASTGLSIALDKEISSGGEGKVWETNVSGYVAKIYDSSHDDRIKKLEVMEAHPPKEPNSHLNHISLAWPKSLLKDRSGNVVGFLMPAITGSVELLDIYNPQRRRRLGLEVDWRFLHTTALNIASIIQAIHAEGYVLGDIKPQNILVNNRALPSIIDTDSFQVRHPNTGKVYRCLVGSEGFTPPELLSKNLHTTNQTEVHDRFRLAVIIHLLLFGDHPFKGKWTKTEDSPDPTELIRKGFWPYAPNSLIQPGPMTIPIDIVHPELHRCFLRCFNTGHTRPDLRPTAEDWVKALKVATNEVTACRNVNNHYYSKTYDRCYWCERATNLGVDIFPATAHSKPKATNSDTATNNISVPQPSDSLQPKNTTLGRFATLLRWIIWPGLTWVAFSSSDTTSDTVIGLFGLALLLGLANPSLVIRFGLSRSRWTVTLVYLTIIFVGEWIVSAQ